MADVYTGMDEASLRTILVSHVNSLSTLTGQTKDDKMAEINQIKAELMKVCSGKTDLNTTVAVSNSSERNTKLRELKIECEKVNKFGPGQCVQLFISKLSNIFRLYVESDDDDQEVLERSFVRNIQSRLTDDYLTQIVNEEQTFDDFTSFKSYLVKNFDSKRTMFQSMEHLLSLNPKSNEKFSEFASRLSNAGYELLVSLSAKAKAKYDKDLTAKQLLEILMGQVLLNSIQSSVKSNDIYKLMASQLDDVWTVSEIAAKATSLSDRLSSGEPSGASFAATGNESSGRQNGKKQKKKKKSKDVSNQPCWYWMDGNCKRGSECPRMHIEEDFGKGRPKSKPSQGSEQPSEPMSMVSLSSFQN